MSVNNCKVNYIKDIDLSKLKPSRAGAIVYVLYKNMMYFISGIDTDSGDITDFSGGIKYKRETFLDGGLRELEEESLGIFGKITPDEIKNFLAVYDDNNIIIFIRLDIDIIAKYKEFKNRLKYIKSPEVKDLKILTKRQFMKLCNDDDSTGIVMYDRIRKLLSVAKKEYHFFQLL